MSLKPTLSIAVYSDSTALPRDAITADETWPILMSRELELRFDCKVNLFNFSKGGIRIAELKNLVEKNSREHLFRRIDIVVLAIGVVDSAPKPVTYLLTYLRFIPIVGVRILRRLKPWLKRNRPYIQKIYSYRTTRRLSFKRKFSEILSLVCSSTPNVFVLTTPIPGDYVLKRSPGWEGSVNQFNQIKRNICQFKEVSLIEVPLLSASDYFSNLDGHHFSLKGHQKIASLIAENIFHHL